MRLLNLFEKASCKGIKIFPNPVSLSLPYYYNEEWQRIGQCGIPMGILICGLRNGKYQIVGVPK